jgi:hypothetical protein
MGTPCEYGSETLDLMLTPPDGPGVEPGTEAAAAETAARPLYLPPTGERSLASRHTAVLDRLRAFYQALSSVHLEAGVWISQPARTGEGSYEYWESGGRYFLRAGADPRLGLAEGLAAAYDGERSAQLFLESSRLSLWHREVSTLFAPFGNPFFLPLIFLEPYDESCTTCNGNLRAVLDEARWARIREVRGTVQGAGRTRTTALLLPGSQLAGRPYYFRVLVNRAEQIYRIDFVRPEGHVFATVDLQNYRAVEGAALPFPHHLVSTTFDDAGQQIGSIHFMIKTLEVNRPVDPERFTISPDLAQTVIDEETRSFLKHPQLKKP